MPLVPGRDLTVRNAAALLIESFSSFGVAYGFDSEQPTDEQRAEFLAFVAHEIGYDLWGGGHGYYDVGSGNIERFIRAYDRQDAERGSGSQGSGPNDPTPQ
jgi:hypothetical protein